MPKPAEPKKKINWRLIGRVGIWAFGCAGVAFGAAQVRAFLVHDPRFELAAGGIEIHGVEHASPQRIQAVFASDLGTGTLRIPLAERRRHLLAVDWVKGGSVTRLWPNRISVTVSERTPVAFASLPVGTSARHWLALIDEQGVLLSVPPRSKYRLPVLSGITEEQGEEKRRERVEAMQHLLADLGPEAAATISEINTADLADMRVIATVEGNAAELWLGDQHFRARYDSFRKHYKEIEQHADHAVIFDLRMDDRILTR